MRRKSRRTQPQKPSAASLLKDINEIVKAINTVKRIANMPGMKSILTSLYGERRYAEGLLAKNYPRTAKRAGIATERKAETRLASVERTTKGEKIARGWRYADAIKKNYSNIPVVAKMSKAQIRGEYKKFKRGLKTRVPDIAFYNPSP